MITAQPLQILQQFAGSESDPSRSTTSARTGEGKTTPDGCKMSARRPSVVDSISLPAHLYDSDAPIRLAAVSGRATSVGHASCGEGDSNGGQPGQPDAHSPDAGGNRADQGAPGSRVESPFCSCPCHTGGKCERFPTCCPVPSPASIYWRAA